MKQTCPICRHTMLVESCVGLTEIEEHMYCPEGHYSYDFESSSGAWIAIVRGESFVGNMLNDPLDDHLGKKADLACALVKGQKMWKYQLLVEDFLGIYPAIRNLLETSKRGGDE